jgi:hypothetical protein
VFRLYLVEQSKMVTCSRYLMTKIPRAVRFATSRFVHAMVTLNFGGHPRAITFVRSFAPTTPRKRSFKSAVSPR